MRGTFHYRRGEYDQAIEAYREGYQISRQPGFVFDIAQAQRLAGRCGDALDGYRRYLDLAPDAPYRDEATQHVVEMESCAKGTEAPRAAPEAAQIARSPPPPPPAILSAVPALQAPARESLVNGPLAAGADRRARLSRPLVVALLATGVAALGVSVYFLDQARCSAREVGGSRRDPGAPWSDADRAAERDGKRDDRIAEIAGGVALLTLVPGGLNITF